MEPSSVDAEVNSSENRSGAKIYAPKADFVYGKWMLVQKQRKLKK